MMSKRDKTTDIELSILATLTIFYAYVYTDEHYDIVFTVLSKTDTLLWTFEYLYNVHCMPTQWL